MRLRKSTGRFDRLVRETASYQVNSSTSYTTASKRAKKYGASGLALLITSSIAISTAIWGYPQTTKTINTKPNYTLSPTYQVGGGNGDLAGNGGQTGNQSGLLPEVDTVEGLGKYVQVGKEYTGWGGVVIKQEDTSKSAGYEEEATTYLIRKYGLRDTTPFFLVTNPDNEGIAWVGDASIGATTGGTYPIFQVQRNNIGRWGDNYPVVMSNIKTPVFQNTMSSLGANVWCNYNGGFAGGEYGDIEANILKGSNKVLIALNSSQKGEAENILRKIVDNVTKYGYFDDPVDVEVVYYHIDYESVTQGNPVKLPPAFQTPNEGANSISREGFYDSEFFKVTRTGEISRG